MGKLAGIPINILYEQADFIPTVSMGIWVNSGSRHEQNDQLGYAHLVEHMAFKAIPKFGARQVAQKIDELGGHLNASTSRENTFYYVTVTPDLLIKGLDLLIQIVLFPLFSEKELKREQGVILEEIKMYQDSPDDFILDYFLEEVYKKNSIAHTELGNQESVLGCTIKSLMDFYNQHYHSGNILFTMVGSDPVDKALAAIEKVFEKYQNLVKQPRSVTKPKKPVFQPGFYHLEKDLEQVQFVAAFPAYEVTNQRNFALELLNIMVGGNQSSLLFQSIREKKGLCYTISSARTTFLDSGFWGIYGATMPDRLVVTLTTMKKELERLSKKFFTKGNLFAAKNFFNLNFLMSLESSEYRMFRLAKNFLLYGRQIDYLAVKQKVDAISMEEVLQEYRDIVDFRKIALVSLGKKTQEINGHFT